MQEQLRVKSLQWLGIKPLCSRLQLPGAKVTDTAYDDTDSQQEQVPELAVLPASIAAIPHQSEKPCMEAESGSLRIRIDLTESDTASSTGSRQRRSGPKKAAVTESGTPKAAAQALKYRLRFVRFGDLLFVLPQPAATWHEENTHLVFMRDIYTALYCKPPEQPLSDVFKWPPSKHLLHGNNAVNAQEALMYFTKGLLEQQASSCMISFGLAVEDYFQVTAVDGAVFMFKGSLPVVAANTIASYFSDPGSKRELWQQLQAIKPDFLPD